MDYTLSMRVSHPDLVVLGLLAGRPRHGYELRKEIESMRLRQWARIGDSTVYAALQRLEERGFLSRETRSSESRPDRNVYRLTDSGRERLGELVIEALESGEPAYSDRLVGGVFGTATLGRMEAAGGAGDDRLVEVLERVTARLADAGNRLADLQESDELSELGRVVSRFNLGVVAAELRALVEIREIVDARLAAGDDGEAAPAASDDPTDLLDLEA